MNMLGLENLEMMETMRMIEQQMQEIEASIKENEKMMDSLITMTNQVSLDNERRIIEENNLRLQQESIMNFMF